jgi:hypothetical protein
MESERARRVEVERVGKPMPLYFIVLRLLIIDTSFLEYSRSKRSLRNSRNRPVISVLKAAGMNGRRWRLLGLFRPSAALSVLAK